jgi:tetratricopeptide (TPR) repeat protein
MRHTDTLRITLSHSISLLLAASLAGPASSWADNNVGGKALEKALHDARIAARQDDHARAIGLYREALYLAPQRRRDILPALALQAFWAGRTEEALPLLREAVELQPADAELRFSLARCALQADLPLESAGHFAVARRLEHRDNAWLDDHVTALHWSGLDDMAARLPASRPPTGIRRRHDPQVTTRLDLSRDSDDIDSRWLRVEAESPVGDGGRFRLLSGAGTLRQSLPRGTPDALSGHSQTDPDIDLSQASAGLRWRFGEPGEGSGIWWPSFTLGERRADDWRLTQATAQTLWFPTDNVWLEASAGNEGIETPRAIEQRISVEVYALAQTFRSARHWHWGLGEAHLRFSDGNQRNRVTGWVERRLGNASPWAAGLSALHFDDANPGGDNGYYSPEQYSEARLYLDRSLSVGNSQGGLRLAGGRLDEYPGDAHWLTALDLHWDWTPSDDHRLTARAGWSDSRAAAPGAGDGYTRKYLGVDWNWRP